VAGAERLAISPPLAAHPSSPTAPKIMSRSIPDVGSGNRIPRRGAGVAGSPWAWRRHDCLAPPGRRDQKRFGDADEWKRPSV